jgi:hypothetical protein
MVPQDELQAVLREARKEEEAAEQRCVKEKVDQWFGQPGSRARQCSIKVGAVEIKH